jgi:prolyl-tRNA synthetase
VELEKLGITVLLDDRRDPSAGVKFKDAELIGIPIIIVVGKALEQGNVEIRVRKSGEKSESSVTDAVKNIASILSKLS